MLTQQENDVFTRVGSGTPGGELLRRYWYPVAVVQELTDERPTKFVRLLGEDLVLFKDRSGRVGLLADRCAHRSASLVYGRVEERGIACAYHGWLYDCDGNILETPPGRNDAIMRSVKQVAYPVRHFIGFYWAYLGPLPPPEIPPYDVWTRRDGRRSITVYPRWTATGSRLRRTLWIRSTCRFSTKGQAEQAGMCQSRLPRAETLIWWRATTSPLLPTES